MPKIEWGAQGEDEVEPGSSSILKVGALAMAAIAIVAWGKMSEKGLRAEEASRRSEIAVLAAGIGICFWVASKYLESSSTEIAELEEEEEEDEEDEEPPSGRTGVTINRDEFNVENHPVHFSQLYSDEKKEVFLDPNPAVMSLQAKRVTKETIRWFNWVPPKKGCVKVNSDGSFVYGRGGTAGGLFRGEHGNWLGGFVLNIGANAINSTGAELWGLFEGLNSTWNMGFRNVIAEVDLESAITVVMDDQREPDAHHDKIIQGIRELIRRPWKVDLRHIYREANSAADCLASLAVKYEEGRVVKLHKPPPEVLSILEQDIEGFA